MNALPHALHASIETIEEDVVLLKLADGQKVKWPRAQVSPALKVGDIVHLFVFPEGETEQERQRIAKEVLNEILKGDEPL